MGFQRSYTVVLTLFAVGSLVLAPLARATQDYATVAQRFADALLQYGTDRYGQIHAPVFVEMLDLQTMTIPAVQEPSGQWRERTNGEWREAMKDWKGEDKDYMMWGKWFSNVSVATHANIEADLSTLEAMKLLSEVSGKPEYERAAEDYIRFFLDHTSGSETGLWQWGYHSDYNLILDRFQGNRHELERAIPPWDVFWRIDSTAVRREIEGLYTYHIKDKGTFAFDRHAEINNYKLEPETNGYNEYAMRYIAAWTYLYTKTGNPVYVDWVHRMLLSRRSKTAGTDHIFPYLWNPDIEPPIGLGWHDGPNISYYLLYAYRSYPDPWLLDPVLRAMANVGGTGFTGTGWGGDTFGIGMGSREAVLAYELTRDLEILRKIINGVEHLIQSRPPRVKMAQGTGQNLQYVIDTYEATGDPRWWRVACNLADSTIVDFQHPSGFIRGTAGLERPDFYDATQGPGELFMAWVRMARLQRAPALVGWDYPPNLPMGTRTYPIRVRLHNAEKAKSVYLLYRLGWGTKERRVEGNVMGDRVVFKVPLPEGWGGQIWFRGEVEGEITTRSEPFVAVVADDVTPPTCGGWQIPDDAPDDEPVPIRVRLTDPGGIDRAILHYTYGNRIGFKDARPLREGDVWTFKIQPNKDYEGEVTLSLEAYDASPSHNWILTPWYRFRMFTRQRLTVDIAVGQTTRVTTPQADMTLLLTGRKDARAQVSISRYPWNPLGDGRKVPGPGISDQFWRLEIGDWQDLIADATFSIAYSRLDVSRLIPSELRFVFWNEEEWEEVPSTVDEWTRSLSTGHSRPGYWTTAGMDRVVWQTQLHGETAAPTLADTDGDPGLEVVSAMGGGPPWGAGFDSDGKELFRLDVGERIRQTGNYSGCAVVDLDGDRIAEILLGSADTHLYCFDNMGHRLWRTATNGLVRGGIAVGDVNGDNQLEIATMSDDGTLYLLDRQGTILWSRAVPLKTTATPVMVDLNGDGKLEILFASRTPAGALLALNPEGRELWRYAVPGVPSDPAVGDVDGDSFPEIVLVTRPDSSQIAGSIYMLDRHGKERWQTAVQVDSGADPGLNDVTMADVDNDGKKELFVTCNDGALYCYDAAGTQRWRFQTRDRLSGSPSFADLDNDDRTDVVIAANDWWVYALRGDGSLIWEYRGVWYNSYSSIGDLNGDGVLEVVYNAPRIPGIVALRTAGRCRPGAAPWPTMRGGLHRTGCYPPP